MLLKEKKRRPILWFLIQFIVSPVSMVFHVAMKQRLALILQFIGFFLRVGSIFLALIVSEDLVSEFYALSGFMFYLIYLIQASGF